AELSPGDLDLAGVEGPCADAPHQKCCAKLVLAGERVFDGAERAVKRQDSRGVTSIDHAGERVVPGVLLCRRPRRVRVLVVWIRDHLVGGVATAYPSRLHAPRSREVRGPQADPCRRGLAAAISSTFDTPSAVSRMA